MQAMLEQRHRTSQQLGIFVLAYEMTQSESAASGIQYISGIKLSYDWPVFRKWESADTYR